MASFPIVYSRSSVGRFNANFNLAGPEADSLLAGHIYVLIDTSCYPDAEIRATLDVK